MKPFNLSEALSGKPVVTRDGRKVTELHHFKTATDGAKICAIINGSQMPFYEKGSYHERKESEIDLFMAPETVTKWISVLRNENGLWVGGKICDTESEAKGHYAGFVVVGIFPKTFEI